MNKKVTCGDEKQSKEDVFLRKMKEGGGSTVCGWAQEMRSAFGGPFLCLVSLVYFTQGFRSFVWTAVSYQMKDRLNLSPSASQFAVSVAYFPWSIKPLYGIISDCIPIRGKKRIPYLVIATVLSLFPWVILGLIASSRNTWNSLTILLTIQNIGSAMADVVIDAMIAEAIHSEQASLSGDLQSLSWSSMALGGILGSLLGGYALSSLRIEKIFLLFSILPVFQLFSCSFVKEIPPGVHKKPDSSNGILEPDPVSSKEWSSREKLNGDTTRRRNKKDSSNKQKMDIVNLESENLQKKTHLSKLSESLRSAVHGLCRAFTQPIILRPMAWFFLSHIMIPNLSTVTFYYQTDFLNLEASFLGNARVIGWLGLMLGTYCYNRYVKRMRLRRILMWSHIGLGVINLLDIALVSRLNVHLGIPDKYMVLFGSALRDAVLQFKMMPFLIISGRLCPPGIEGTLFALFMSINNLGSTFSSFLGASVASILNISSGSFDNLLYGLTVQQFATFLPIAFLFLIPSEATDVSLCEWWIATGSNPSVPLSRGRLSPPPQSPSPSSAPACKAGTTAASASTPRPHCFIIFLIDNCNMSRRGNAGSRSTRLLLTVTVLGSAGPIRFVVNGGDLVAAVIGTALKFYAKECRLPVLGSDLNNFLLYRANEGAEALNPWEPIGLAGSRNFLLCKKLGTGEEGKLQSSARAISWKNGGSWKAWLNKSLHLKVSSH